MNLISVINDLQNDSRYGKITTALYPCSGTDTKPFTFTHPDFFRHRNVDPDISPNLFIYIDKNISLSDENNLEFEDDCTAISVDSEEKLNLEHFDSWLLHITWKSREENPWMKIRTRQLAVIYIKAKWQKMPSYMRQIGWVPDIFVGVTDGCYFGTNEACVNDLTMEGVQKDNYPTSISKYYISDHFYNHNMNGNFSPGDCITSKDPDFPFKFKKLALLSTEWGNYGKEFNLGGTTLFEVININ
ncbi:hypothetical protein ACFL20_06530 [Spirochaetota bacterium]